jgi:hypothetical protein
MEASAFAGTNLDNMDYFQVARDSGGTVVGI